MHKDFNHLLIRQLRKYSVDSTKLSNEHYAFLEAVSDSYSSMESAKGLLEQSVEVSSREMMRSNLEMQAIINGLPDKLYRIEENGDVIDIRSREIACNLSYGEGDLYERMHERLGDDAFERLKNGILELLDEPRFETFNYATVSPDQRHFELRIAPLEDGSLVAINREVTELIQVEDKLEKARDEAEQANRAKSLFLANMSHEIRTPINGIIGMTELLNKSRINEYQQSLVDMLKSSSKNLLAIIDDILDISRAEVSGLDLHISDFSVRECIERTVKQVLSANQERNDRICITIEETVPDHISGDEARITQVLTNLLANAMKYSSYETTVELTVSALQIEHDGFSDVFEFRFDVADQGVGIPGTALETIFKPFFQHELTQEVTREGVGLGLAITRKLIELMQGELTVDSTLGKGSVFSVSLPLRIVNPEIATLEKSDKAPARKLPDDARILVAEDHPINQKYMKFLLEQMGLEAVIVENGQIAIDEALTGKYKLVLMDCRMPVMDGWEATREIRRQEKRTGVLRSLPIIALTAHAMKGDKTVCLNAGMTDYLSKPVDEKRLAETLDYYLNRDCITS